MDGVILVGGLGTRLQPLTLEHPKPLLPVANKPMLRWIIDKLRPHVRKVHLACRYLVEEMEREFADELAAGTLSIVKEEVALGTGGAIKNIADMTDVEYPLLVYNGDIISSLPLDPFVQFHRESHARGTLALYGVDDPTLFGIVGIDDSGEVTKFLEKPKPHQVFSHMINAGTYILEKDIVDSIPTGRKVSIEREVFPEWTKNGLYGFNFDGYWIDAGTPPSYIEANRILRSSSDDMHMGTTPPEGTTVDGLSVLGPDVTIGQGAIIECSVIMEGARIGQDAQVRHSIVGPGTEIPDGSLNDYLVMIPAGSRRYRLEDD